MSSSEVTRICVEKILPEHRDHYNNIKDDSELSAAFWGSKLWPQNSTVTIGFLDNPTAANQRTPMEAMEKIGRNIDPLQKVLANAPLKDAVKTVVHKRIQPLVNLKLKFVEDSKAHSADIRITFKDSNASWSSVGTDSARYSSKNCKSKGNASCVQPSMNLGWFDVGTYIHEFGHAIGMIHEHQNPHGKSIDWNVPKLMDYMERTQGWDKEQVEINAHYSGYLPKQESDIRTFKKDESLLIPNEIDYDSFSGLSNEVKSKLKLIRPKTLGQALRIDGVTPAAAIILLGAIKKTKHRVPA